jgi:predicted membrane protein
MRLVFYQEKIVLVIVCAALFSATHLGNAWLFQYLSLSDHISWIYLPAFLRVMYVLVLGPWWGFAAIFVGSMVLAISLSEHLNQALLNAACSALSPVLAVWLFRILKERSLVLSRLTDLIELSLLYALLNAVIHHLNWALQQPDQLLSAMQLPIMVAGDLMGTVLGAFLFTQIIRYFKIYGVLERLSKTKPDVLP